MDPLLQTDGAQLPAEAAGVPADLDALQNYIYGKTQPSPTHLVSSGDLMLESALLPITYCQLLFLLKVVENTGVTVLTVSSCFSRF